MTARHLDELRSLCGEIDREWQAADLDLDEFPGIVERTVGDFTFEWVASLPALLELLGDPEVAALQHLSSFSDLYVLLFDNGRFWVEVLNWCGSDINIHDHDFAGVQFQAGGESLNVEYGLDAAATVDGVVLGRLVVRRATLWPCGARSIVKPGRVAPHNVCHLSPHTVSVLIRTHPRVDLGPQWNYFPPGVASSYGVANALFRKQVKAMRLLARADTDAFVRSFGRYAEHCSAAELLFCMVKMTDVLFEGANSRALDDLLGSGRPIAEELVRGVVAHRAMEMCKQVKNRRELTRTQNLALAVLGSSFDAESASRVAQALPMLGGLSELQTVVCSLLGAVGEPEWSRIRRLLPSYGLGVAA